MTKRDVTQCKDISVATENGSEDLVKEDKSSVISEFEDKYDKKQAQFLLLAIWYDGAAARLMVMKLAQKRSKIKKKKNKKTCCCASAGLSHSGPDLGSFQTAVVQY